MGQMYSDLLLHCCTINHKVTMSLWDRRKHQCEAGLIFHFSLFLLHCSPDTHYNQLLNPPSWHLHIRPDLVGRVWNNTYPMEAHYNWELGGRLTVQGCFYGDFSKWAFVTLLWFPSQVTSFDILTILTVQSAAAVLNVFTDYIHVFSITELLITSAQKTRVLVTKLKIVTSANQNWTSYLK